VNLSRHFTYEELVYSETAVRRGIANIPDPEHLINLKLLCEKVLEPVRFLLGDRRILVSSGFRCPEVNSIIGGSRTSQHMIGQAVDFSVDGIAVPDVVWTVLESDIPFDQVINEFGHWIHISHHNKPRRQGLVALKDENGATEYRTITPIKREAIS
jgi:zinc D-Ala-D-Ala carboxypeptidase